MKPRIDLITIWADDVLPVVAFYRDVMGFKVQLDLEKYVEFESQGVRFAICARSVMVATTDHPSYKEAAKGQAFELAFPLDSLEEVDRVYADIMAKGATPIQSPAKMAWGQYTAFFADPEGNIHELFSELPEEK